MADITDIMDMLDWQMPPEIQAKGISLARNTETIVPFIQPLTPRHSKNVWENCAVIIAEKSDEILNPYLVQLLEWLQDLNWPGAFCILNRLQKYSDNNSIHSAINDCIKKQRIVGTRFGKVICFCYCGNIKVNPNYKYAILKSTVLCHNFRTRLNMGSWNYYI
ncbi:MAG: DUF5071 domain-containing protein [Clostridia bacterium]|nr:DUF5071 domain-containing protein [Clostridia bacterium]